MLGGNTNKQHPDETRDCLHKTIQFENQRHVHFLLFHTRVNSMTRKKWTKPPQEAWLKSRRDAFRLAEANDTRKEFFKKTYEEWLQSWPNPKPTAEQIADAKSVQQAENDIYAIQQKVSLGHDFNEWNLTRG